MPNFCKDAPGKQVDTYTDASVLNPRHHDFSIASAGAVFIQTTIVEPSTKTKEDTYRQQHTNRDTGTGIADILSNQQRRKQRMRDTSNSSKGKLDAQRHGSSSTEITSQPGGTTSGNGRTGTDNTGEAQATDNGKDGGTHLDNDWRCVKQFARTANDGEDGCAYA